MRRPITDYGTRLRREGKLRLKREAYARLAELAKEQSVAEDMRPGRQRRFKAILEAAEGDGDAILVLACCLIGSSGSQPGFLNALDGLIQASRFAYAAEYPTLVAVHEPRRSEEVE